MTEHLRAASAQELIRVQTELGELSPTPWRSEGRPLSAAGCFVAFARGLSGHRAEGDCATAAAAVVYEGHTTSSTVVRGHAGAPYEAGLLYLREGQVLEAAVRRLPVLPDGLLVNGTGLDHPRRAGLSMHLGALLDLPTVGITHRPLCSEGTWPDDDRGGTSPLLLDGDIVALLAQNTTRGPTTGGPCCLADEPRNCC